MKSMFRNLAKYFVDKSDCELSYWKKQFGKSESGFANQFYQKYFMNIAGENNTEFLTDKIIVDFGCGPRGSLHWITNSRLNIGVDILANRYFDSFKSALKNHNMLYLQCSEKNIPVPDNTADIVFTMNSLDHTDKPETMCSELIRILKVGGLFLGSFNLNEKPTPAEPCTLTEDFLKSNLLNFLEISSYRLAEIPANKAKYDNLLEDKLIESTNNPAVLWVKAYKRRNL
ncbi:MAG: methyltransferase domain-containing protein [Candidatus Cloacimonetes bacterium]|nr:methyltransferase domain-containing protein [Candidatus Cloacimonadota bacterium]